MKLNFRISLWNYFHYSKNTDLETTIKEIAQNGFGIEVWPWWKDNTEIFNENHREFLKKILEGIPTSFHSWGADTFEKHKIQIDTAHYVGADVIVCHSHELKVETNDYVFAQEIVNYATSKGIIIALENGYLNVLKKSLEKIKNLKICLDIGHIYCNEPKLMKNYVDELIEKMAHLHLQDTNVSTNTDDHFPLGEGSIPIENWKYLIKALERINYQSAMVFEIMPLSPLHIAQKSQKFLQKLVNETKT